MRVLKKLGFEYAADYTNTKGKSGCEKLHLKWKGKNLKSGDKVYCFVVAEKICYVGETTRKARMFQYHNNTVMKKVRDELLKKIRKGKKVQVWVCTDFSKAQRTLLKKTFTIGRLGLEALLIDNFKRTWNLKR
ncbi:MAG TPA: hypothetical protein VE344_03140 [Methylomirabilota bacterium]|nr:hypothetical protein [Methylomirabilota bacterium]